MCDRGRELLEFGQEPIDPTILETFIVETPSSRPSSLLGLEILRNRS